MARVQGAREEHDRSGRTVERLFNCNRRLAKDVEATSSSGCFLAIPGAVATRSPTQAEFRNRLSAPLWPFLSKSLKVELRARAIRAMRPERLRRPAGS